MATPNDLVEADGEIVLLKKPSVTHDDYGQADISYEEKEIKAVISSPSETTSMRNEGRLNVGDLVATVDSELDVSENRNGSPDLIVRNDKTYEVVDVSDDQHFISSIQKKTLTLSRVEGRSS